MNGTLATYENNSMALSCRGEILIQNGVIKHISHKGYPRTRGRDFWLNFYETKSKGDIITESDIAIILRYNGRNNVVSRFQSFDKETK